MNALLVNADDFGLHVSINEAIADCVDFGSVNSVSVIANGAAPDYELLRTFSKNKCFVGAHITWVGEPWLTENILLSDWKELLQKIVLNGKPFRQKLQHEAEAQIVRLLDAKFDLSHIDSHQHLHHLPSLWDITAKLMEKYKIPRVRIARVNTCLQMRETIPGIALNTLARTKHNALTDFFCAGIKYAGNQNGQRLEKELKLSAGYNTELIVHPGKYNPALNKHYPHWNFNWEEEYTALMSQNFLHFIAENNFRLMKNNPKS